MKKTRSVVAIFACLMLFSCGFSSRVIEVPNLNDTSVYNAMWDAAISQGLRMGYTLDYQNKSNGELRFSHEVGDNKYQIRVAFGNVKGKPGALVVCKQKDLINPFVSGDAKKIEEAIKKAAGLY